MLVKIYFATENTNIWIKKIKNIISGLGFSHVLLNPTTQRHASFKQMQDCIKDQGLQEQDSLILNSSKMDYYKRVCDLQAHYKNMPIQIY